jgi:selenocysteine-specific elongation factor
MTTVKNFTIGMAGHIDHGKTTLTKALSGIDTDTLKEEKERKITIEPGFAPFLLDGDLHTSIVDVPGHEKFIRQMIAGVAGIDLVLLVIAADEGVMPQTKEHFEILSFLNIKNGLIVVSKSDLIDEEMKMLLEDEILELTEGSHFQDEPVYFVDSISMNGIDRLKVGIAAKLRFIKTRIASGPFRMPLDHIFSVKGQGTVVRGTVFEGEVKEGQELEIQPGGDKVKVRKLQVHKNEVDRAQAGQRTAINVSGGSKGNWGRGHVLLTPGSFSISNTIDLVLTASKSLTGNIKQRSPIKFYTGTVEVMGKIIFFDRNELEGSCEEVFCQVRLEESIVAKRGDYFILRRPSPEETVGGGTVIDPNGSKYKFGQKTVQQLTSKYEGTPEERIFQLLEKEGTLDYTELQQRSAVEEDLDHILTDLLEKTRILNLNGYFITDLTCKRLEEEMVRKLRAYHMEHSMRPGIPKAELIQSLKNSLHQRAISGFVEMMVAKSEITMNDQYIQLPDFSPHFPAKWEKRIMNVISVLEEMEFEPESLFVLFKNQQLPEELFSDFKHYLAVHLDAHVLFDDVLISDKAFKKAVRLLKENTNEEFSVQDAKAALNLSRKFLIPLLEQIDSSGLTVRNDMKRSWK